MNRLQDVTAYTKEKENKAKRMRLGKQVPESAVNLSYIQTAGITVDETMSLVDTSYVANNVIPDNQLESIVVANAEGKLEYVNYINKENIQSKAPGEIFPSDQISLTRKFNKNEIRTENALYYKVEIDYHYDSLMGELNEDGEYDLVRYRGNQIQVTDEFGHPLDGQALYEIYTKAHLLNPHIHTIVLYMHDNTNEYDTFKIRYNHVDALENDADIVSVKEEIQLYVNSINQKIVSDKQKTMLESGKIRIVNGESVYQQAPLVEVLNEIGKEKPKEIFAVVPDEAGKGYRLTVPHKTEMDPRQQELFSYRVIASYVNERGESIKQTIGHISDSLMHPESLLKTERAEYTGNQKRLGIPDGLSPMNIKQMMELSLPYGTPSLPADITYTIEDGQGNLLYTIKNLTDNPRINSGIDELSYAMASGNQVAAIPWENAEHPTTALKELPFPHRFSVIPEQQVTKWDYKFSMDGNGVTESKKGGEGTWRVCADVGFKKTAEPVVLDVLSTNKWQAFGLSNNGASALSNWVYRYEASVGKSVITYRDNTDDVAGFYQTKENIGGTLVNMMDKSDYEFSVKVKMTDTIDDDAVGLMFRVRDSQHYYMFMWEKDQRATSNQTYAPHPDVTPPGVQGPGRVKLDQHGYTFIKYSADWANSVLNYVNHNDLNKYMANGMGSRHKQILKAKPSIYSKKAATYVDWDKDNNQRYVNDSTNCSFEDITSNENYSAKGWEPNKEYKITVKTSGNTFRIYINENANSTELGSLVCQATDSTYPTGTYGIFCLSQRWTYWYDFKMVELDFQSICSDFKPVVLDSADKKKLSNSDVMQYMKPYIDNYVKSNYPNGAYEVLGYSGVGSPEVRVTIDAPFNYIYGQATDPSMGSTIQTPWNTQSNGLTINGQGTIQYHADGHYTITQSVSKVPEGHIPAQVVNFEWKQPVLLAGAPNTTVRFVKPNDIYVTGSIPAINRIGKIYHSEDYFITKSDGVVSLKDLFGEKGLYASLGIPETVPKEQILLRIERGHATETSTTNAEYRVNYRFKVNKNGNIKMPVDQFQDQLGINRLRFSSMVGENGNLEEGLIIDVSAWTHTRLLEAIPLFAVKVEEDIRIKAEKPRVEPDKATSRAWHVRVKNGKFTKRIQLPYHEMGSGEEIPNIYKRYPMLYGMVGTDEQITEIDMEYMIPEYNQQEFYQDKNILIQEERPRINHAKEIQVKHRPIVTKKNSLRNFNEVWVIRNNQKTVLRIADIDSAKGIYYLLDEIQEKDEVYVRYGYKETWYEYKGFDKVDYELLPIVKPLNIDIVFEAEITASISYEPSPVGIGKVNAPKVWCPTSKSQTNTILLAHSNGQPFTGGNNHANFITLIRQEGASVAEKAIELLTPEDLKQYSFVVISNIFNTIPPDKVAMFQQYFAEGGSGLICSEHSGMTTWYPSFDAITAPWGAKTIPNMFVFSDGRFSDTHNLTKDIAHLKYSMSAASGIDLGASEFKAIAFAPSGEVMAAVKETANKGRVFLLSDSNFLTDHSIPNTTDLNNGNIAFAKKIVLNIVTFEGITIDFTSEKSIKEIRIFINKPYGSNGTGAYVKAVSFGAGNKDITEFIMEADTSSSTGNLKNNDVNTVIIELINTDNQRQSQQFNLVLENC